MVCNRCKMVVTSQLNNLDIHPLAVELGEVVLEQELTPGQKEQVEEALTSVGFELIDDKKSKLIERIKTLIIELVQNQDNDLKINLSEYLNQKLNHDYNYISNLFSEVEGTTIEKYFIAQKIEKVKELLVYGELTTSEIAYKLNYSSVAYLSNQFKKITGLSPSHFKEIGKQKRKSLDQV